jgi:hypothetical protein
MCAGATARVLQVAKLASGPHILRIALCLGINALLHELHCFVSVSVNQGALTEEKVCLAKLPLLLPFKTGIGGLQYGLSRNNTYVKGNDRSWPSR